jgi:hypothetical protein
MQPSSGTTPRSSRGWPGGAATSAGPDDDDDHDDADEDEREEREGQGVHVVTLIPVETSMQTEARLRAAALTTAVA